MTAMNSICQRQDDNHQGICNELDNMKLLLPNRVRRQSISPSPQRPQFPTLSENLPLQPTNSGASASNTPSHSYNTRQQHPMLSLYPVDEGNGAGMCLPTWTMTDPLATLDTPIIPLNDIELANMAGVPMRGINVDLGGMLDSGASSHFLRSVKGHIIIDANPQGNVVFGSDPNMQKRVVAKVQYEGIGEALVVEDLKQELISVSKLGNHGLDTLFIDRRAYVYQRHTGIVSKTATQKNGLYFIDHATPAANLNILDIIQ